MKKVFYYDTQIGKIGLAEEWGFLTNLYFMNMNQPLNAKMFETDILKEAFVQVSEYLCGERKEFDLPLNPSGTNYQQTVWSELLNIPYGEIRTYKEISEALGESKGMRAVGNANNKNPIPIIIPCHRVISSDGNLAGYVGGIDIKKKLLDLEKSYS
ncbi:methylated-DNA--[protein]-cysteine S-methyltransferase [bacterium]|nr:methylated-DNA--[protein]-cysteine S-methyltransferase [bacterium]